MKPSHVLVVEDEAIVRADLARVLAGAGFQVSEAGSAERALQLVEAQRPDIALLDVRLPGMSGLQLGTLLASEHQVPFVVLSAHGDSRNVNEAIRAGALGYLLKPLEAASVVPTLQAALMRAQEVHSLMHAHAALQGVLDQKRLSSVAVGILMCHHRVGRDEAFELLRHNARYRRRKLEDVAIELVDAQETLSELQPRAAKHAAAELLADATR